MNMDRRQWNQLYIHIHTKIPGQNVGRGRETEKELRGGIEKE